MRICYRVCASAAARESSILSCRTGCFLTLLPGLPLRLRRGVQAAYVRTYQEKVRQREAELAARAAAAFPGAAPDATNPESSTLFHGLLLRSRCGVQAAYLRTYQENVRQREAELTKPQNPEPCRMGCR